MECAHQGGSDKALDTALIHGLGIVIALPMVAIVGLPPRAARPFLAASGVVHLGYYVALVGAYKHGELGLTYPVMRGLAPLLVATASAAPDRRSAGRRGLGRRAGGERGRDRHRPVARRGRRRHRRERGQALRYALANAAIIALYTVIDGLGVRAAGNALAYVATLFLFEGPALSPPGAVAAPCADAVHARHYARARWPVALLGTAASFGSMRSRCGR